MSGRLLVAYGNASNHVPTTAEYLASIARYSAWEVSYVHVTHGAEIAFDLNDYDALFQSYCARLPEGRLSPDFLAKLKGFHGIKLLSVQDEYERTDALRRAIRDIGYHAVFTGMPPETAARIFPRQLFPTTDFITVLTGYVPEGLALRRGLIRPLLERPIGIGYRGRDLGARYGARAFEKVEIGRRMREICIARGVPHDIEWTEDKRLYGEAWYDFVSSCRSNLGSETGSNVFDFDGAIEAEYARLSAQRGAPVPHREFRGVTDPVERQYDTGLISPRIFEATALRTPMILFTGRYSGLIEPDEHYIELKKDFSNVDAVLARIEDLDWLQRLADRAYGRLVGSGDFSYRRFVGLIDATLAEKSAELGLGLRPPRRNKAQDAPIGADLEALKSRRETATAAPRHPVFFRYKSVVEEHAELKNENDRLTRFYTDEITKLGKYHQEQTAALIRGYRGEIGQANQEIQRLHDVYKQQIREIQQTYTGEIANLNAVIDDIRARFGWLIRIHKVYKSGAARIDRLGQILRKKACSPP